MRIQILVQMNQERRVQVLFFVLANGPVKWKCSFSQEIPLSTCEAEVRAVSAMLEPVKHCIWIDRVLHSLGLGEDYISGAVQISSSIDSSVISPIFQSSDSRDYSSALMCAQFNPFPRSYRGSLPRQVQVKGLNL